MSIGGSKSDSESSQTSTSSGTYDQNVWQGQVPSLQSMYGSAGSLFGQTNNNMQGAIPGVVDSMQQNSAQVNPYWQNQLGGGAYQDMGLQNSLMSSLNQSLDNPSAMQDINAMIMGGSGNNYAEAMRSQYIDDASNAQNMMMNNMDASAVAAGQSGSSRHGVAQGLGMEGIMKNLQGNLAKTGYETFDADLNRKLGIAQQADQGTLARQQMMSGMIGDQNQTQQNSLGFANNMNQMAGSQMMPYMAPFDALSGYANAIGRPTVLGSGEMEGTSTGSSDSGSAGFGFGF